MKLIDITNVTKLNNEREEIKMQMNDEEFEKKIDEILEKYNTVKEQIINSTLPESISLENQLIGMRYVYDIIMKGEYQK